jgi:diphosphomevalonate decarboxylase
VSAESKATAVAHPNIAWVKYWGKRDDKLVLPHQSSVSITLAPLEVITTVQLGGRGLEIELNGRAPDESERGRIEAVLTAALASASGAIDGVKILSRGNFPMAAGLASSAAGFAALAVAVRAASGLSPNAVDASILARAGSGSACRSIPGGFCVWRRGTRKDGRDSYASQLFDENHWPQLRLVVALVSKKQKEVSSREGMRRTVETSPYYAAWVTDAEAEARRITACIEKRDIAQLGEIGERNAWRMHAAALAAQPALCYLEPATLQLILSVREERRKGMPVWFTLDAGPNPVLLTESEHAAAVEAMARQAGATETFECRPGGGARVLKEHLF